MEKRLNQAPCGWISLDRNSCIQEVNQTILEWTGYALSELVDKHIETFLSRANKLIFHSYFIPTVNIQGSVDELFINFKSKSGESLPLLMNAKQLLHGGLTVIDCALLKMEKRIEYEQELRSVKLQMEAAYAEKEAAYAELEKINIEIEAKHEELIAMNTELIELSKTDKLTGIPNRRYLQERLTEEMANWRKTGEPFSVLMLDIDHFKSVNDTYGHQTGDEVLSHLGFILKRTVRTGDFVARYGGEEFTILLPKTCAKDALRFACSVNKKVEEADWKKVGSLTISIGVAEITPDDTEDSIIEHADQALYMSKKNGRNRSSLYRV